MPSLNEILYSEEYTPVPGYEIDENYSDSNVTIISDRTIGNITGITTHGEVDAQYIVFKLPRKPDGYDLVDTNLRIYYEISWYDEETEEERIEGDDVSPINVMASEDYILMGWVISHNITNHVGVFSFIIHAFKNEEDEITYHFKTLPKVYSVSETLIPGQSIIPPSPTWFDELLARMANVIGKVNALESGFNNYKSEINTEVAGIEETIRLLSIGEGYGGTVASYSNLPAPSAENAGKFYVTKDTGRCWLSDGTTWIDMMKDFVPLTVSEVDNIWEEN